MIVMMIDDSDNDNYNDNGNGNGACCGGATFCLFQTRLRSFPSTCLSETSSRSTT